MTKKLLLSLMLSFLTQSIWADEQRFKDIALTIGESKTLQFADDIQIHLSRKDILDLLWLEPATWRVTGLKKGSVLLRATRQNGEEIQRIMISVTQSKTPDYQSSGPFQKVLAYSCKANHIICEETKGQISGSTKSWSFYLQTQYLCDKAPPCQFELTLEKTGWKSLEKDLKRYIHKDAYLSMSSNRKLMVHLPCNDAVFPKMRTALHQFTNGSDNKNLIGISCNDADILSLVHLKTKVFYLNQEDISLLGLDIRTLINNQTNPFSKIAAFIESHKERIISSPEINIVVGSDFSIKVGGEVHYPATQDHAEDQWKSFGVLLSGKTSVLNDHSLAMHFNLELKLPNSQRQNSFKGSSMTSHTLLQLNHPKIVGEVEANFLFESHHGVAIVEDIPIIGPLFTWQESKKSKSRMYLWMTVEKLPTERDH